MQLLLLDSNTIINSILEYLSAVMVDRYSIDQKVNTKEIVSMLVDVV